MCCLNTAANRVRLLCTASHSDHAHAVPLSRVWVTEPAGDHCTTIVMAGELDSFTVRRIEPPIIEYIKDRHTVLHVLVDLAGVSFCDAAGIGFLVRVNDALLTDGRFLTVHNPSPIVTRVLQLTGLDESLPIDTYSLHVDEYDQLPRG